MAQLLIPHSVDERLRLHPGAVVESASPAPRDIWRGVLRDDPAQRRCRPPSTWTPWSRPPAAPTSAGSTSCATVVGVLPLVRRPSRLGLHLDQGYPDGYGHGGMLATGGLLADDVRAVAGDLRGSR